MTAKPRAVPLVRTTKQVEVSEKAAEAARVKAEADAAELAVRQASMRTAQIANLLIGGHTFESIGAATGASAKEVEDMLNADSTRYIRSQPALRQWVRRWASGKYSELLGSVWDQAVNPNHREQLAYQDRARPLVERITKLHGAEAPTQAEVKIEQAPESVQRIVDAIAASQGMGYDVDIFDTPDVVDGVLVDETHAAEIRSAEQADSDQPEDEEHPL